jgi:hypothetical protein
MDLLSNAAPEILTIKINTSIINAAMKIYS